MLNVLPGKESLLKLMLGYISDGWPIQGRFCHFFLDKKVTKKSSLSNAPARKANTPLAGQAAGPPGWSGLFVKTHKGTPTMRILKVQLTDLQYLIQNTQHLLKKKRAGLFAQRGCDGLVSGSIGQSAFFGYFLGKQKVTNTPFE